MYNHECPRIKEQAFYLIPLWVNRRPKEGGSEEGGREAHAAIHVCAAANHPSEWTVYTWTKVTDT